MPQKHNSAASYNIIWNGPNCEATLRDVVVVLGIMHKLMRNAVLFRTNAPQFAFWSQSLWNGGNGSWVCLHHICRQSKSYIRYGNSFGSLLYSFGNVIISILFRCSFQIFSTLKLDQWIHGNSGRPLWLIRRILNQNLNQDLELWVTVKCSSFAINKFIINAHQILRPA